MVNIGQESETIEFKKTTSELKEGVISIASILNKHNKGALYFGVRDNGDVKGQEVGKDTQRDISRAISGNIKPECFYEVNMRKTSEGESFIEVLFGGDDAPYSAYGRYYQRFADEDRAINDKQLEKLFRERRVDYSEWENRVSKDTAADVSEVLISALIEEGNESGHLRYTFVDKDSALKKFGLLSEDNIHLNNAGRVLFSENGPIMLKLATFATDTKTTFIKLDHYTGNVFTCIDKGIEYIAQGIDYFVAFRGSSGREEKPEIPLKAVREIVVNAFAHGCYDSNTAFEIDIFKDRVTIYSPGSFPRGYVPEDFANQSEKPIMLNPIITETLFRTGKIESFGSGFERTFEECRIASVDYCYRNLKSGFEFEFKRALGHKYVQELSKTEMAVFEEIRKNNFATANQISEKIGKSEKTVYRAIKKLKELQKIERKGDDYNGSWIVKE